MRSVAVGGPQLPPEGVPEEPPALPAVPGPIGQKVLLFEFIVLVEYWTAPLFLDVTNYAGIWSELGSVLLVLFASSLALFVLRPLRSHLRAALSRRRDRAVFHAVWAGTFAAGLFATSSIQFVGGAAGSNGAALLGESTVYTPFGAWPSATAYLPHAGLFFSINIETVLVFLLLGILSASAVVLGPLREARECAPAAPRRGLWGSRLASAAIWSPLGFLTGCASCAPAYLALLGLVAPGAAAAGFSFIPLVPWIGLAGLLYLASFGLAIVVLRRSTRGPTGSGPDLGGEEASSPFAAGDS